MTVDLAGNDVVVEVRIDRRFNAFPAGLHIVQEVQQPRRVEAFGKALAVHQAAALQLRVGMQEAVGGDEVDARMIGPARQQRAQHAGRRALSDRHRSGDAEDVGHVAITAAEEAAGDGVQLLGGGDVQIEQARQRQVDLLHLLHRQIFDQTRQLFQVARHQRHRRVGAQLGPLLAREHAIGREGEAGAIGRRHERRQGVGWRVHGDGDFLAAFSARPDVPMRCSSSRRTSVHGTCRLSSSTSR